ncbi:hypothetical protein ERJ75_001433600 [Trypanosoma vivax]|nr:hypothetical protein ERJ75_001433600 [Trypanosoma vivax]
MDSNVRVPFRVNLSQARTVGSSLAGLNSTLATPRDLSALSEKARAGVAAAENTAATSEGTSFHLQSPRSTRGLNSSRQRGEQIATQIFGKHAAMIGARLNIDLPSFSNSQTSLTPRVRPTSALPPTKAANDVPRSMPTAVKMQESICHQQERQRDSAFAQLPAPDESTSQLAAQPENQVPQAAHAHTTAVACSSSTPPQANVLDFPQVAAFTGAAAYSVCPLCGVTVLLMGGSADQQRQWQGHMNSWVHQRYLQMRNNPSEGSLSRSNTTFSGSPPITPSVLKALEEVTAAQATSIAEHTAAPPTSSSGVAQPLPAARQEDSANESKPYDQRFSKAMGGRGAHGAVVGPSDTVVQLTDSHNGQSSPNVSAEGAAGSYSSREVSAVEISGAGVEPVDAKKHNIPKRKGRKHAGSKLLSDSEGDAEMEVALLRKARHKKDNELKRILDNYLSDKRRRVMLICLRRWFNSMFVRVIDSSHTPKKASKTAAATAESGSVGTSPAPPTGVRSRELDTLPLSSPTASGRGSGPSPYTDSTEGEIRSSSGVRRHRKQQSEVVTPANWARGTSTRERRFMASCSRDVAHVGRDALSGSFDVEVAKTDVSWYVVPPKRCKSQLKKGSSGRKIRDSSKTSFLEDDSSIEELLCTLAPPVQERVRAVLHGRAARSSAFPKTSDVIRELRASPRPSQFTTINFVEPSSIISTGRQVASVSYGAQVGVSALREWPDVLLEQSSPPASHEMAAGNAANAELDLVPGAPVSRASPSVGPSEVTRTNDIQEGVVGVTNGQQSSKNAEDDLQGCGRPFLDPGYVPVGHNVNTPCFQGLKTSANAREENSINEPTPGDPNGRHSNPHANRNIERSPRPSLCEGGRFPPESPRRKEGRGGRNGRSSDFRGAPGEYYVYHGGAYQRVRDPTDDVYCDMYGQRLPMYYVRRYPAYGISPKRNGGLLTTRPRSPLGPARLNPYCSVCVARYNIIVVDENMYPIPFTGILEATSNRCACESPRRKALYTTQQCTSLTSPSRTVSPRRYDSPHKARCSGNHLAVHAVTTKGGDAWHACCGTRAPNEVDMKGHIHPAAENAWLKQQESQVLLLIQALQEHQTPDVAKDHGLSSCLRSLSDAAGILKTLQKGKSSK